VSVRDCFLSCQSHMDLLCGIDLFIDIILWLEVDCLECRL